jgi:kynurenine formamidase
MPHFDHILDLSAPLGETTPMYPGDPVFNARRRSTAEGITITEICTGLHAGTHVDAPFHFIADGKKITDLPLSAFYGEAVCIDAPKKPGQDIGVGDIRGAGIRRGDIVLFRTGWEERSGTTRFFQDDWPGFAPEAVEELARMGAKAIGGDIPSADSPKALRAGAPGHIRALGLGMPIFEALAGLSAVVDKRFTFCAFPLRLVNCEASPVRAVAILS